MGAIAHSLNSTTLLKSSTIMKPTFLSKTIGTIGLIAALSTIVTAGILPSAQAQMDINVPAEIDDEACIASGFNSFYLLQNIDLSYEQMEEIFALQKLKSDTTEQLVNSYPAEDDLSGSYAFVVRPGAIISSEISAEMDAAALKITSGEAMIGQIAALNE